MNGKRVDPNLVIDSAIERQGLTFVPLSSGRFCVNGVFYEDGHYARLSAAVAKTVSEEVLGWSTATAGGRVRFCSDSPYIAVSVILNGLFKNSHIPVSGSVGCDLYVRENEVEIYRGTFMPPMNVEDRYESVLDFGTRQMREITIHLPTYSGVRELYIGFEEGCAFAPARDYTVKAPVVFYGSSITQGACASRPGNTYESMLSRLLDFDYLNLGFSGSAKGEPAMAEYIASLSMSAFVYDYDYNAPSVEHLSKTHAAFLQTVLDAHPSLPVLLLSRPKYHLTKEEEERCAIIRETYENARKNGANVHFLSGKELVAPPFSESALVDNIHPTDCGFMAMTQAIAPILKSMLRLGCGE